MGSATSRANMSHYTKEHKSNKEVTTWHGVHNGKSPLDMVSTMDISYKSSGMIQLLFLGQKEKQEST